ncbi:MAG: UvrD-helicase domain-containing protein [Suilimivivens sp.]
MAVTFTEEQLKAITLHDRNILVSAAAGSGKTAVLVERIIRMITRKEAPVDIDRLLVVTFTSAAAAEMRERISLAIERALLEDPENEHLQKQSTLLHNAKITTIDSFCLFVVRNNFNDIGLDPAFRIADEGELKLMKQDVLTELLEEWYQEGTEEFHACVEYFTGGSSDRALEEYIGKLHGFAISHPWPEEWLKEREEDYKITDVSGLKAQEWVEYLLNYVLTCIREDADRLREAVRLAEQPSGPWYYGEMLEREVEMLEAVAGRDSYQALGEAFSRIHFDRLPGKKDDSVDPVIRDQAKEIRNAVKKQIDELQENFFLLPAETVIRRMQEASGPVRTLLALTIQFLHRFEEKKRQENVIDFSDMEHMALQILLQRKEDGSLASTPAAREYRQFLPRS